MRKTGRGNEGGKQGVEMKMREENRGCGNEGGKRVEMREENRVEMRGWRWK
jgi:hypothetical protein